MAALPAMLYEHGDWRMLVVDKAHCVRIASDGGHQYSTPADYIGKKVSVRICRRQIEIYDQDTKVCLGTHQRVIRLAV